MSYIIFSHKKSYRFYSLEIEFRELYCSSPNKYFILFLQKRQPFQLLLKYQFNVFYHFILWLENVYIFCEISTRSNLELGDPHNVLHKFSAPYVREYIIHSGDYCVQTRSLGHLQVYITQIPEDATFFQPSSLVILPRDTYKQFYVFTVVYSRIL